MTDNILTLTISARNLSRDFGSYPAVKEINLELKHGEVLGFLGPNGAGKTTTMRMLTGNLAPSSGSVEICGIDLLDKPSDAKLHIGYLPETPPLYQELTVNEYLLLAAKLHRVNNTKISSALDEVKLHCGLEDIGNSLISSLSKGYQQRVGIAQAIIHEPDVIILDEPTVGLDPNQMREILSLIRNLGTKRSVILSTHILSEVTNVCDRVQIMHQGQMVLNDSLSGLKEKGIGLDEIFSQLTLDNKSSEEI
jgi:ABC-2 type transport system ATP-binding protein